MSTENWPFLRCTSHPTPRGPASHIQNTESMCVYLCFLYIHRARSAVGRVQGLVSQGSGFDPYLFHKACYMPITCRWRFEVKLGFFFFTYIQDTCCTFSIQTHKTCRIADDDARPSRSTLSQLHWKDSYVVIEPGRIYLGRARAMRVTPSICCACKTSLACGRSMP